MAEMTRKVGQLRPAFSQISLVLHFNCTWLVIRSVLVVVLQRIAQVKEEKHFDEAPQLRFIPVCEVT